VGLSAIKQDIVRFVWMTLDLMDIRDIKGFGDISRGLDAIGLWEISVYW